MLAQMKSERDWRIIPVLLTALSRVRLARSAFLLFFTPHLSPFRFPRHPFSYMATRTTGSLNFISSLGYGLPRVRSASLSSPLLYPRPLRPWPHAQLASVHFPSESLARLIVCTTHKVGDTKKHLKSIESIIITNEISLYNFRKFKWFYYGIR